MQPNPQRLSIPELVAVLHTGGATDATAETIAADIDAGCPVNDDGTINLAHFGAWLVKEDSSPTRTA